MNANTRSSKHSAVATRPSVSSAVVIEVGSSTNCLPGAAAELLVADRIRSQLSHMAP